MEPLSSQPPVPQKTDEHDAPVVPEVVNTVSEKRAVSPSFSEGTARLQAISSLITAIRPLIWLVVLTVVLLSVGGKLVMSRAASPSVEPVPREVIVTPPVLPKLDAATRQALQQAHTVAEAYAQQELDAWETQLESRLDNFLDWYFRYDRQKIAEATALLTYSKGVILYRGLGQDTTGSDAVALQLTETFQKQFAKQVLLPREAQLRFELIAQETVERFVTELSQELDTVRTEYRIPQARWNRYIDDMAVSLADSEGNISNLSVKALVGGAVYVSAKPMIAATVGKIGAKVSSQFAGAAASSLAAKTGATVAAKFGSSLIDPLAGVGILVWDLLDHRYTSSRDRPIVKANLISYLHDMEQSLLTNPETGIMSAIYQVEQQLSMSLADGRV